MADVSKLSKSLGIEFINNAGDSSSIVQFSKFVQKISDELNLFYNYETKINAINDESEKTAFYFDLSSLLHEIGCPFKCFSEGTIEDRFEGDENNIKVLRFLMTELAAARAIASKNSKSELLHHPQITSPNDSSLTTIMKPAMVSLSCGKPPDNMSCGLLFDKLTVLLKEKIPKLPKFFWGKSLLPPLKLTEQQWHQLAQVVDKVNSQYLGRNETFIQRADVTVQSFKWSDIGKKKSSEITDKYAPMRSKLKMQENNSQVTMAELLSARDWPLTLIQKTSSGRAREQTTCQLNKIKIGKVPDRGGRASEMEPPPPEMPSWQKRDNTAPTRGGRGGGRGNYSQHQQQHNNSRGGGGQGYRGGGGHQNNINSQSVAPNNYYSGNQHIRDFVPQFQQQYTQYDNNFGGYHDNRSGSSYDNGGNYHGNQRGGRGRQGSSNYRGRGSHNYY